MTPREHVYAAIADLADSGHFDDGSALDLDSLGRVLLAWALDERLGVTSKDGVENTWVSVGDVVAWAESVEGRAT